MDGNIDSVSLPDVNFTDEISGAASQISIREAMQLVMCRTVRVSIGLEGG
jgi:hypothetical protein